MDECPVQFTRVRCVNMIASAYNRYFETQVQTAPPENLVLMLYNGALRFATQAVADLDAGRMQDAHNSLIRAQDIISELAGSLNMDVGEISRNLLGLYDYMQYRLIQANINKIAEPIREVVTMLTELRDSWAEAIPEMRGRLARSGGE